ncbi:MAG: hypothetical protein IJ323_01225 [Clostridia bacterium]|nr:hypothetical protein [Clostridia bacterium]
MKYIEIKAIKKEKYKDFIKRVLKENDFIIISLVCGLISEEQILLDFGESIKIPETCDFHIINISEMEDLYCYDNCYHKAYSIFSRYDSLEDFLNFHNIYCLMFATKDKVTVVCMCDAILEF